MVLKVFSTGNITQTAELRSKVRYQEIPREGAQLLSAECGHVFSSERRRTAVDIECHDATPNIRNR